jgi:ribosomal protein L37E
MDNSIIQECDTCGRYSHLKKGMCIACTTKYKPVSLTNKLWQSKTEMSILIASAMVFVLSIGVLIW